MEPSWKSEAAEQQIRETAKVLTGVDPGDRRETIRANRCQPPPFGCGRQIEIEEFETWPPIDVKEYKISGLCNICQAKLFEADEEDSDVSQPGPGEVLYDPDGNEVRG